MSWSYDMFPVRHHHHIQDQQDDELAGLDDVSSSRNNESVLIKIRSTSWIVERYSAILVVVW